MHFIVVYIHFQVVKVIDDEHRLNDLQFCAGKDRCTFDACVCKRLCRVGFSGYSFHVLNGP